MASTRWVRGRASIGIGIGVGVILALALVACGGDEKIPTAAEDKAQAERIVLTEADVPGLIRIEDGASDDEADAIRQCLNGNAVLTGLGDGPRSAESNFANEDETVVRASSVSLAESECDAEAAFAEISKSGFKDCFGQAIRTAFEQELGGSEASISNLSVAELPVDDVGEDSVGYRATLGLEVIRSVALSFDYVFIREGRGLAVLFAFDVDGSFDAADRTRLSKVIADRLGDA